MRVKTAFIEALKEGIGIKYLLNEKRGCRKFPT